MPGSPAATTSIDGRQIPPPPPKFGGKIERNAAQSKPYWPPRVVPPKGAPNILLIMTDDVGFGAPSTFGGVIPTPALDRIAASGLRYTNFHSTALCSPTRAALITGRNHHSVGFGVISELATGYPGYDSFITRDKATIGRILKDNGYRTSWFGKDHNVPAFQASQDGPFDQWPVGMGFDHFYGFLGGDTSQWEANVFLNTTPIYPYVGHPGWNLTTAMADEAIAYMNRINTLAPEQPFFVYYVPGGTHAPHHATPEWIKKASDLHLFDQGWNALREQIFANQKKLGVIPQDAKLTPWPHDLLKNWDEQTADEKKMFLGLGMGTLAFNNMSGIGRSGTGVLKIDGKEVASQKMEHTIPLILQWDENFDVGADTGTPVDDGDYQTPFEFTGKLNKLTLTIERPTLTPEDEQKLMQATRNNKAILLLTVVGGNPPAHVVINEMTTVASVVTHAQFIVGAGIKGSTLALRIAAGNVPNFVDLETGGYGATIQDAVNSGQTPTMANFATFSSILAGCVTQVKADACSRLYAAATPPSGGPPIDILSSVEAVAFNPWHQPDKVFALLHDFYPVPTGKTMRPTPFMPYLTYSPSAWVFPLKFTGGGLSGPGKLMFDSEGNAWAGDNFLVGA